MADLPRSDLPAFSDCQSRGDMQMNTSLILLLILIVGFAAYLAGRSRAIATSNGKLSVLHSLPGYHGTYAAICAIIPAVIVLAVWAIAAPAYIDSGVRDALPETVLSQGAATTELALGQVKSVANGLKLLDDAELAALNNGSANLRDVLAAKGVPLAGEGEAYMIKSAAQFNQMTATSRVLMAVAVLLISAAGAVFALRGIT
ncbi:MAG: phosphate ABC transporter permease family protein, partial [Rhizobium giardinii]